MSQIGFYRDENYDLNVQGIKISSLAKKYGTTLFIYDSLNLLFYWVSSNWRRERDSNPRYGTTAHSLSKRAP